MQISYKCQQYGLSHATWDLAVLLLLLLFITIIINLSVLGEYYTNVNSTGLQRTSSIK